MMKKIEEAEIVTAIAEVSLRDKALAELGKVDKGIADLKAKFAGQVYDCTTTAGMAAAKEARLEVRDVRYQVPKIAEKVTKQLNALKAEVKDEAERIVAELLEIENVSHLQIQAEEDRKAEIKRLKEAVELQRVTTIKERIAVIASLHLKLVNVPNSLSMRDIIQTVKEQVTATEAEFQEWQPMAAQALENTLREMEIIVADKESAEIEEIRKANEYQRQQFELKVQGMIQEIRGWAYSCFGHDSAQMAEDHAKYSAVRFTAEECGEFLLDVEKEAVSALIDIEGMVDAAKKREESDRLLKEQQDKLDKDREDFEIQQKAAEEKQDKEDILRAKIQALREYYVTPSMTSAEIKGLFLRISSIAILQDEYGDFYDQAIAQQEKTVQALMEIFNERTEKDKKDADDKRQKEEKERTDREAEETRQREEFEAKMRKPYAALAKIKEICENKELTALAARNQINAVADIALEGKE